MRRILLPIIAALTLGSQAQALELTVEQCVAMGLEKNPALKAHEAKVESSQQDARIAFSAFLPTLQARGTYATLDQPPRIVIQRDLLGPGAPASDTEIRGENDFYFSTVTLRQTLFAGGRITHAYQRDNELLASARHEFGNQRTQLVYDLKRTFYETLTHRAYLDSTTQQLSARQEGLRVATALAAEGLLSADKVLLARAKLMFSEAELLQSRQRADDSLDQLRRLLDVTGHEDISLVDVATYPVLDAALPDLSEAALERREDYKQLELQIKAAEASINVAKSGYLPQIYAEGGYLRQRETDLTQADNWGVSVNLDWPLFEGGKTDAEVVKATVEKQRLENLRRDLAAAIRNEVQSGQRLVQQKQSLVEAYLINLQAEERVYRDILAQQEQGEIMATDQQEHKASLLIARANYLESVNQLRIAIAALEATAATPLDGHLGSRAIYQTDAATPGVPRVETEPLTSPAMVPAVPAVQAVQPQAMPDKTPLAVIAGAPLPGDGNSFTVQLGAFKSKAKARALVKSLQKRYPERTFETAAIGGWHKVRTVQLSSRDAAETALQELGGKGLVVRATGHR